MDGRERAADLFARGLTQAFVAAACGVSRSTACRWHRRWVGGSLSPARRGRRPTLDGARLRDINRALAAPPRVFGFSLERWSLAAVSALIEQRTGVRYHPRHVGRVLRRAGWIVPPVGRVAGVAVRRRTVRDIDGNSLALMGV